MPASPANPDPRVSFHTDPPPVCLDEHGRYRVGQTGVLLDLVVQSFDAGATPEQIVQNFDSLTLADTYGAIAYYLRHRDEVHRYLAEADRRASVLREQIETRQGDMQLIRDRLLARKRAMDEANAAVSQ